jgi:hypothetical protein
MDVLVDRRRSRRTHIGVGRSASAQARLHLARGKRMVARDTAIMGKIERPAGRLAFFIPLE